MYSKRLQQIHTKFKFHTFDVFQEIICWDFFNLKKKIKNDPDLFPNNLMKTMLHGIIDNQASIQDFDSPTLLKTNSSSSVTQQPMFCEQIVSCLASQKWRGVWILG